MRLSRFLTTTTTFYAFVAEKHLTHSPPLRYLATMSVDKDSPLAQAIQKAVQPKLIDNGWVADENDTELSEYVTLMVISGKTQEQVVSEVGTELLGVGEDDPAVAEVARWLFSQVPALSAQVNGGGQQQQQAQAADQTMGDQSIQSGAAQAADAGQDAQMDDASSAPEGVYVYPFFSHQTAYAPYMMNPMAKAWFYNPFSMTQMLTMNSPSGPKAMRNGTTPGARGRGGRMLGQMHRNMDRSQDDPLRRIKGAAGGQAGRINAHAGRDAPRGPRGNLANGMQRAMNGRPGQNAQMFPQQPAANLSPQQQMQFLQMMEMQSNMMAQMFGQGAPNMAAFAQPQQGHSKPYNKRGQNGVGPKGNNRQHIHPGGMNPAETSMDVDTAMNEDGTTARKDPFDTLCKFNDRCTNPTCHFAHQSPAAPPGTTIDLSDRCSFGAACENKKCAGKHPSSAQRRQHLKEEVDCKFYPHCTNANCPFKHPDMPLCRNGANCTVPGCKFTHSKIMCRYNPCLNAKCTYKHAEGQKRGTFEDKVWTPGQGQNGAPEPEGFDREAAVRQEGKSDRFAGLKEEAGAQEELILPGRSTPERAPEDVVA